MLFVFIYTHDSHIRWCSCRLTVRRRVSHVEQELGSSCCSIFRFPCNVLYTLVCPFSFGHCIVCP